MNPTAHYAQHDATELAIDETFIAWVKWPDVQNEAFWKAFLADYPGQAEAVARARAIVEQVRLAEAAMPRERALAVWNAISTKIEKEATRKTGKRIALRSWMSMAAAVIIVAAIGSFLLLKEQHSPKTAQSPASPAVPVTNDLEPGKDRAILTLADGRKVDLDMAANGTIAAEGAITIQKKDGLLAYDHNTVSPAVKTAYNTLTTPRGGRYHLVLADGTQVWLNASSSIYFPQQFMGKERRVQVTGEAYFEVTHKDDQPFIVQKGDASIRVLGTQFNVNAYEDEAVMKVTLLKGKISVSQKQATEIVFPGQQAILNGTNTIQINNNVNTEQAVAWKNGLFLFDEDNLPVIMRQLARWYDAEIHYEGSIPDGHFTGAIRRQARLSEVLRMLELAGGVHFTVKGKQIRIEKKN